MLTPARSNRWFEPNSLSLNQTDETLAMAIGTIAFIEKAARWPRDENNARYGALNPAAMAPATPQPMKISVLRTPWSFVRKLPIVANAQAAVLTHRNAARRNEGGRVEPNPIHIVRCRR